MACSSQQLWLHVYFQLQLQLGSDHDSNTITLHSTTLHYTALHYTALHYTALHYTTPHYTTLHCITQHCITLHRIACKNEVLTSDMKAGKLNSAFMIFSNIVSLLRLVGNK